MPQPNILLICSDQLAQQAVGAYGNEWVRTPNVDTIAKRGARLENVYTPCPLCQPARAAFWSGLHCHQTGILSNGRKHPVPTFPEDQPTLGTVFRDAGYRTIHFGKEHDAGALNGFERTEYLTQDTPVVEPWPLNNDTYHDVATTRQIVDFLASPPQDKPFLMVADLQNPHNICGYVGERIGRHVDPPIPGPLPPLPPNFEIEDLDQRPKPVQYICCSHRRLSQAAAWSEENYRHYIAAYYHYVQRMDGDVGRIIDALNRSGMADNTLVIFFADHGDGIGCHRMITKQVSFYEETTRVPWIAAGPGIVGDGRSIGPPLVSLLDLAPTLCDYAAIHAPRSWAGRSVLPWLKGEAPHADVPEYVVSQWHTEWGYTIEPGRMLRTQRYKYTRYREENGEELFDLEHDPYEQRTLVNDPAHAAALAEHRKLFEQYVAATGDPFHSLEIEVDPRFRSHELGYPHHPEGGSAPEVAWAAGEP